MIAETLGVMTPDQVQHSVEGWFDLISRMVTLILVLGTGLNQFFTSRRNHKENKEILVKQDILHETMNGGFREAVNVSAEALTHVATLIEDPEAKRKAEIAAQRAREKAASMNSAAKIEAARTIVGAVDTLKRDK